MVIEDVEIELSRCARLQVIIGIACNVSNHIEPSANWCTIGSARGIGLSSRRQSEKLERQSAKCKHRHCDIQLLSVAQTRFQQRGTHPCILGQDCLSELTAAKFASKTRCVFPPLKINSDIAALLGEINSSSARSDRDSPFRSNGIGGAAIWLIA